MDSTEAYYEWKRKKGLGGATASPEDKPVVVLPPPDISGDEPDDDALNQEIMSELNDIQVDESDDDDIDESDPYWKWKASFLEGQKPLSPDIQSKLNDNKNVGRVLNQTAGNIREAIGSPVFKDGVLTGGIEENVTLPDGSTGSLPEGKFLPDNMPSNTGITDDPYRGFLGTIKDKIGKVDDNTKQILGLPTAKDLDILKRFSGSFLKSGAREVIKSVAGIPYAVHLGAENFLNRLGELNQFYGQGIESNPKLRGITESNQNLLESARKGYEASPVYGMLDSSRRELEGIAENKMLDSGTTKAEVAGQFAGGLGEKLLEFYLAGLGSTAGAMTKAKKFQDLFKKGVKWRDLLDAEKGYDKLKKLGYEEEQIKDYFNSAGEIAELANRLSIGGVVLGTQYPKATRELTKENEARYWSGLESIDKLMPDTKKYQAMVDGAKTKSEADRIIRDYNRKFSLYADQLKEYVKNYHHLSEQEASEIAGHYAVWDALNWMGAGVTGELAPFSTYNLMKELKIDRTLGDTAYKGVFKLLNPSNRKLFAKWALNHPVDLGLRGGMSQLLSNLSRIEAGENVGVLDNLWQSGALTGGMSLLLNPLAFARKPELLNKLDIKIWEENMPDKWKELQAITASKEKRTVKNIQPDEPRYADAVLAENLQNQAMLLRILEAQLTGGRGLDGKPLTPESVAEINELAGRIRTNLENNKDFFENNPDLFSEGFTPNEAESRPNPENENIIRDAVRREQILQETNPNYAEKKAELKRAEREKTELNEKLNTQKLRQKEKTKIEKKIKELDAVIALNQNQIDNDFNSHETILESYKTVQEKVDALQIEVENLNRKIDIVNQSGYSLPSATENLQNRLDGATQELLKQQANLDYLKYLYDNPPPAENNLAPELRGKHPIEQAMTVRPIIEEELGENALKLDVGKPDEAIELRNQVNEKIKLLIQERDKLESMYRKTVGKTNLNSAKQKLLDRINEINFRLYNLGIAEDFIPKVEEGSAKEPKKFIRRRVSVIGKSATGTDRDIVSFERFGIPTASNQFRNDRPYGQRWFVQRVSDTIRKYKLDCVATGGLGGGHVSQEHTILGTAIDLGRQGITTYDQMINAFRREGFQILFEGDHLHVYSRGKQPEVYQVEKKELNPEWLTKDAEANRLLREYNRVLELVGQTDPNTEEYLKYKNQQTKLEYKLDEMTQPTQGQPAEPELRGKVPEIPDIQEAKSPYADIVVPKPEAGSVMGETPVTKIKQSIEVYSPEEGVNKVVQVYQARNGNYRADVHTDDGKLEYRKSFKDEPSLRRFMGENFSSRDKVSQGDKIIENNPDIQASKSAQNINANTQNLEGASTTQKLPKSIKGAGTVSGNIKAPEKITAEKLKKMKVPEVKLLAQGYGVSDTGTKQSMADAINNFVDTYNSVSIHTPESLGQLKMPELQKIARGIGIKRVVGVKKDQLIKDVLDWKAGQDEKFITEEEAEKPVTKTSATKEEPTQEPEAKEPEPTEPDSPSKTIVHGTKQYRVGKKATLKEAQTHLLEGKPVHVDTGYSDTVLDPVGKDGKILDWAKDPEYLEKANEEEGILEDDVTFTLLEKDGAKPTKANAKPKKDEPSEKEPLEKTEVYSSEKLRVTHSKNEWEDFYTLDHQGGYREWLTLTSSSEHGDNRFNQLMSALGARQVGTSWEFNKALTQKEINKIEKLAKEMLEKHALPNMSQPVESKLLDGKVIVVDSGAEGFKLSVKKGFKTLGKAYKFFTENGFDDKLHIIARTPLGWRIYNKPKVDVVVKKDTKGDALPYVDALSRPEKVMDRNEHTKIVYKVAKDSQFEIAKKLQTATDFLDGIEIDLGLNDRQLRDWVNGKVPVPNDPKIQEVVQKVKDWLEGLRKNYLDAMLNHGILKPVLKHPNNRPTQIYDKFDNYVGEAYGQPAIDRVWREYIHNNYKVENYFPIKTWGRHAVLAHPIDTSLPPEVIGSANTSGEAQVVFQEFMSQNPELANQFQDRITFDTRARYDQKDYSLIEMIDFAKFKENIGNSEELAELTRGEQELIFSNFRIKRMVKRPSSPRYTKQRTRNKPYDMVLNSPIDSLRSYAYSIIRYTEQIEFLDQANKLLNKAVRGGIKTKQPELLNYAQDFIQTQIGKVGNDELAVEAIANAIMEILGKDGSVDAVRGYRILMSTIRNTAYLFGLGFKASNLIVQPALIVATGIPSIGLIQTAHGVALAGQMFLNPALKKAIRDSGVLDYGFLDSMEDAVRGHKKLFQKARLIGLSAMKGDIGRSGKLTLSFINDLAMLPFTFGDKLSRAVMFFAKFHEVYSRMKNQYPDLNNMPEAQWNMLVRRSRDFSNQVNFLYGNLDAPAIFRSQLGRTLMQYKQFIFAIAGWYKDRINLDIKHMSNAKKYWRKSNEGGRDKWKWRKRSFREFTKGWSFLYSNILTPLVFGIGGIAFIQNVSNWWENLFGVNPVLEAKQSGKVPYTDIQIPSKYMRGGLPAYFGVDVSASGVLGIGQYLTIDSKGNVPLFSNIAGGRTIYRGSQLGVDLLEYAQGTEERNLSRILDDDLSKLISGYNAIRHGKWGMPSVEKSEENFRKYEYKEYNTRLMRKCVDAYMKEDYEETVKLGQKIRESGFYENDKAMDKSFISSVSYSRGVDFKNFLDQSEVKVLQDMRDNFEIKNARQAIIELENAGYDIDTILNRAGCKHQTAKNIIFIAIKQATLNGSFNTAERYRQWAIKRLYKGDEARFEQARQNWQDNFFP